MGPSANYPTRKVAPSVLAATKILIVEDNYIQASYLLHCASEFGAEVVGPLADAESAIAAIALEAPSAALVDLALAGKGPEFDVVDALLGAGVPLVIVSGYDRESVPSEYRGLAWVSKPATLGAIELALVRAIEGEPPDSLGFKVTWDGEPSTV